jgi:chromosome segregation ATPase
MKRASDKYSQKIQDALNNLVELNTNISEKNAEIVDLTESQEKKMTCLIEVESLLSERQAELDKINLAILDGNNQLGTLTQRELDQLNELQARYNELEETLTSTKTFHREEIKQLKIQLEAAHSSNEEELMTKLEACELAGSERANELQDLKSLLESKEETIAQLSSELEMAQLNLAADIDDKDTLILEKEYEIDALNQKLADLTAAHDEKLALLEKQIDDLHSSRSDDALTLIDLDEEKDLMRKEIEGLQNECEGLTEDKQALVAERDKLLEERDRLVQELDKALEETMMDLPMISDIEDNELLDQLKEEKLELETAKRDLQERVDSLEADLDRNMEELLTANQVLEDTVTQLSQLKETYNVEVNTLKAQLAAIPTDSHNAEDTEAINVLQTELNTLEEKRQKEIYALEEKRKKEVAHLQQQIQSFSSMQEEMRGLKSSYNIAITNQASLKAKFLEMGIVTLLSISSSLFTFKFAQDYFVYFGYVMIAACILDLLWCGYRLKENLAVATDMVNIEEQN